MNALEHATPAPWLTQAEAYKHAKHKSYYGHRCWLAWPSISGEWHADREDRDSLNWAIDAQQVHGRTFYAIDNGIAYAVTPKLAELRRQNLDL